LWSDHHTGTKGSGLTNEFTSCTHNPWIGYY